MNPTQALDLLDRAAQNINSTRDIHNQLISAVVILREVIEKKEAKKEKQQ